MLNDRLKKEYMAVPVPELKTGILQTIHHAKKAKPHRKIRVSVIAAAVVMAAVLGVAAGAVADGLLNLQYGSYYTFMDMDGNPVKPNGFHLADSTDVPLSEAALTNIRPYVFLYEEDETYYEAANAAEMEAFIDRPMRLPQAIVDTASRYCLWTYGQDGEPVTIYVQISTTEEQHAVSMKVHLRGGPVNILTKDTPKIDTYALPDGTPASIAIAESLEGETVGFALYRHEDAVYHLTAEGGSRRQIRDCLKAILDTVK